MSFNLKNVIINNSNTTNRMKSSHNYRFGILALAIVFLAGCNPLNKMVDLAPQIKYSVKPEVLEMHGDTVLMTLNGSFPPKFFNKNAEVEILPVLKYQDGEKTYAVKKLQGEAVLGNNTPISFETGGSFSHSGALVYDPAMRLSTLELRVKVTIKGKSVDLPPVKVADAVMSTATLLQLEAMPIKADDKFVRVTNDSKGADIHFVINKADIRDSEIKAEDIKALIQYIKENAAKPRSEFKGFEISAYASPDGPQDLNTKLSAKRLENANQFLSKSFKKDKIDAINNKDLYALKSTAEDWDGFKKLMEESNVQDKELILRVLSMYSDPDVREKEIKNIAEAYTAIKDQVLPKLRRSMFNVKVAFIGYSDEELKNLAINNPDTLKLEELMYAGNLFSDINDQLKVYQAAARNFADDWRPHNNVGYCFIKLKNASEAKMALEKAKQINPNNPLILNNLAGVALMSGDFTTAEELYNAAAGAGSGKETSYGQAIIATKKGKYEMALNMYASSGYSTFNFALCKILNFSFTQNADVYPAALGILSKIENADDAIVSYLKAIISARQQERDNVFNNLRTAVDKNPELAKLAKTDVEFAKYFQDDTFKTIVK